MSRRVLITGGSGFVGQWLSKVMLQRGWTVFAGTIEGKPSSSVLTASELDAVQWVSLDIVSQSDIERAVQQASPDDVVHLAGIAFPPNANADPVRAYEVNALGAMRLLTVLAAKQRHARVVIVGTAEQYGPHPPEEYPLKESAGLLPLTAYAGSKAAQELIALQIARGTNLSVICTRSFNHSGPGHGADYLLPSLARRVAELPQRGGTLRMGNGSPVRDYLHVADVVDAYLLLLERGTPGEIYNVCSGQGTTVRELAERVLARFNASARILEDPTLVRLTDVPLLIGDNAKLRRATDWTPQRSIDDIIDDLIHAAPR